MDYRHKLNDHEKESLRRHIDVCEGLRFPADYRPEPRSATPPLEDMSLAKGFAYSERLSASNEGAVDYDVNWLLHPKVKAHLESHKITGLRKDAQSRQIWTTTLSDGPETHMDCEYMHDSCKLNMEWTSYNGQSVSRGRYQTNGICPCRPRVKCLALVIRGAEDLIGKILEVKKFKHSNGQRYVSVDLVDTQSKQIYPNVCTEHVTAIEKR